MVNSVFKVLNKHSNIGVQLAAVYIGQKLRFNIKISESSTIHLINKAIRLNKNIQTISMCC